MNWWQLQQAGTLFLTSNQPRCMLYLLHAEMKKDSILKLRILSKHFNEISKHLSYFSEERYDIF